MRAKLIAVEGGASIDLVKELTLLGRDEDCDIRIDHKSISKLHCVIVKTDGLLLIRDLGSTNGIVLNGRQTQAGDIKHGYRFEIGSQGFQFVVEKRDEEPDTYELTGEM